MPDVCDNRALGSFHSVLSERLMSCVLFFSHGVVIDQMTPGMGNLTLLYAPHIFMVTVRYNNNSVRGNA